MERHPQQAREGRGRGNRAGEGADAAKCSPLHECRVPLALVRLTNVHMLCTLELWRAQEEEQEVPVGPWAEYVCTRLWQSAEWEKRQGGKGDSERWQVKWGWLDTPII